MMEEAQRLHEAIVMQRHPHMISGQRKVMLSEGGFQVSQIPLNTNLGEIDSGLENGKYNTRGTYTSTTVTPPSRNEKLDPPTLPVSLAFSNRLIAAFKPYNGRPRLHF